MQYRRNRLNHICLEANVAEMFLIADVDFQILNYLGVQWKFSPILLELSKGKKFTQEI